MEPRSILKNSFLAILILMLLCCTGCAFSLFPQPGAVAQKDSQIALLEGNDQSGTIETDDLQLNYVLAMTNGDYSLTGTVVIKPSITMSFDRVKSLFIKMSFLDDSGAVLQTVDVTPLVSTHNATPEKLQLNSSGALPAGAKAVAFSWYGSFYSGMVDMSGSWEIHYFPFTRQ